MKKNYYLLRTKARSCPEKFVRLARYLMLLTLLFAAGTLQGKANARDTDHETTNTSLQQQQISGAVIDEFGNPLIGATIRVNGTNTGTVTDAEGKFSVSVPGPDAVLIVTFIGYLEQEVPVAGQTQISVTMVPDIESLQEIVVVGYGTQKRTTVTGAVSVIKGDDVAKVPVPTVANAIGGKLAGVVARQDGGQPGEDNADIKIRGIGTIGESNPLIVVDGVIRDNLQQIDPNIIESISVLKDASAVAPYGMGGANGVILITTKKGAAGKPKLSLNTYYGVQSPTYYPDLLNAVDYMKLRNEALINEGSPAKYSDDLINNYADYIRNEPDTYADSKVKDLFDFTMPIQKHDLQLTGGSENLSYFAGIGYIDQKGLVDQVGYERWNYSINLNSKVTDNTSVALSILGSIETKDELDHQIGVGQLFRSGYKYLPTEPLIYSNGLWGQSCGNTPVGVLNSAGYEKDKTNNILTTISIEQKIPFIQGLSFKGAFSYDTRSFFKKGFHTPFYYYSFNPGTGDYDRNISAQEINAAPYTYLYQQEIKDARYTFQGFMNYNRTFGKHDVGVLFVAESRNNEHSEMDARINNYNLDIDEFDMGSSDNANFDIGGKSSEGAQIGYVYRVTYAYSSKYMLEVSGRYDGHYYFAPGKRWGYFPAASIGWRISEESFMKNLAWLNNLKLRASMGKSGNLTGKAYQYLSGYTLLPNAYAFGSGSMVQGAYVDYEANPEITWEVATKSDVGFEASLWKDLLKIEFDYFYEKRTGMLLEPNVTVPFEYGLKLSQTNAGKMDSYGFELTLGTKKTFASGLYVDISGNLSIAKNKVIETFETPAQYNNLNRRRTGKVWNTAFGYKALGLFSMDDDVNGDGLINADDGYTITQFGVLHPGDIKYADLSGPDGVPDGIIDGNDECEIGYPNFPLAIYGINASAAWKGVDLSLFFQGAGMSSAEFRNFQTVPFNNNDSNADYEYYNDHWTPENQGAKYPRATSAPYSNNYQTSSFYRFRTDYLRLKNATLGYTLPKSVLNYVKFDNVRIYVSGQNLLTFSKIKFIDPENPSDLGYPNMRVWTVGANITF
ncbi:MAG: TonB-dependent receptor [Bacteroidales bacterium]|nr:TonB-dependent receptor [Bacteroidales bacterium]